MKKDDNQRVKIEGHNLVRDCKSMGLCSTDKEALNKYKRQVALHRLLRDQQDEISKLQNDLKELKSIVEDMKNGTSD